MSHMPTIGSKNIFERENMPHIASKHDGKPIRHGFAQHAATTSNDYSPPMKIEKFAEIHDEPPFSPSKLSLKGRRKGYIRILPH
jgi:hypothetical protein